MNVGKHLEVDDARLTEVCRRFRVAELSVFGSALRDDFGPDSDVDLLYVLEEDANVGWEIVDLQGELAELLGRNVDLVSKEFLRPRFAARVLPAAERIFTRAA